MSCLAPRVTDLSLGTVSLLTIDSVSCIMPMKVLRRAGRNRHLPHDTRKYSDTKTFKVINPECLA